MPSREYAKLTTTFPLTATRSEPLGPVRTIAVTGGKESNWTVGVNWYWRSNFKFSANYVMVDSDRRGIQDDPNILEARASFFW